MIVRHARAALLLLLLAAGCRAEQVTTGDRGDAPRLRAAPALTGDLTRDRAELARLDSAAAALATTDGCDDDGACATIAVGERACGGPRHHLAYCRLTTDEPLLRRQVDEIARFEREMNARYGIASTCEYRLPPAVGAVGGSCRATAP